jgi:hypothetical protein
MLHVCPIVSKFLYMVITCFSGIAMLNLCLDDFILIIWGQRLICHHECLARLIYLVEGHKFFYREDISCTKYKSENEMFISWKICYHVICAYYICFWVLNSCMMPTNEKSLI